MVIIFWQIINLFGNLNENIKFCDRFLVLLYSSQRLTPMNSYSVINEIYYSIKGDEI